MRTPLSQRIEEKSQRCVTWNLFLVLTTWITLQAFWGFARGGIGFYENPGLVLCFELAVVVLAIGLGISLTESRKLTPEAHAWRSFLIAWVLSISGAFFWMRLATYDGWNSGHLQCCNGQWF